MGYCLASVAAEMSAIVTLVSALLRCLPKGVSLIAVNTHGRCSATLRELDSKQDIFIGAAAVADYTPVKTAMNKIKKIEETITLEMKKIRYFGGCVTTS